MFYFYRFFRPGDRSKSLHFASVAVGGYKWEELETLDDKEGKCFQDIELMRAIYPKYMPQTFKIIGELVNMDYHRIQVEWPTILRKYILFQHYLDNDYLLVNYPRKFNVENPFILKKGIPGIYKDFKIWDIKNAYPTTSIKKLDSTLYYSGDFSALQKKIMGLAKKYPEHRGVVKGIANTLIGEQNAKGNWIRNNKIWADIVGKFSGYMRESYDKMKDVCVYANTDSFGGVNLKKPEFDSDYEVKLEDEYDYVKIWNADKRLGIDLDNRKIIRKGFRFDWSIRKLINRFEYDIDEFLFEHPDCIDKVYEIFSVHASIEKLKKMDREMFITMVRKVSDTCKDDEFLPIWHELFYGFNELVQKNDGRWVHEDSNEPDIEIYNRKLIEYLKQYI